MRLYEISNAIMAALGETGEEFSQETLDNLAALEMQLEHKIENVLRYRQELIAGADAVDNEVKRLKEKADALRRKEQWLKNYVLNAMQQVGVERVTTPLFNAAIALAPLSVEFDGSAEIPEGYQREEIKISLDKKKVLADFKAGIELPLGLGVKQNKYLRVT